MAEMRTSEGLVVGLILNPEPAEAVTTEKVVEPKKRTKKTKEK